MRLELNSGKSTKGYKGKGKKLGVRKTQFLGSKCNVTLEKIDRDQKDFGIILPTQQFFQMFHGD